jgi:hypothetical protein
MTFLVPPENIEEIVGVSRHHDQHWGRAVSAQRRVYILHSQECLDAFKAIVDSETDLRDRPSARLRPWAHRGVGGARR